MGESVNDPKPAATDPDGPVETPWGDCDVRLAAPADLQLTLFTKTG
jgi:hypothetical protein